MRGTEFANNGYRDGFSGLNNTEDSFKKSGTKVTVDTRKVHAVRSYFEWMPIRYVYETVLPWLNIVIDCWCGIDKPTLMTVCESGDHSKWANCWISLFSTPETTTAVSPTLVSLSS
jgi:hypothetical protein